MVQRGVTIDGWGGNVDSAKRAAQPYTAPITTTAPKPPLSPTRTATQDWTVTAQRPATAPVSIAPPTQTYSTNDQRRALAGLPPENPSPVYTPPTAPPPTAPPPPTGPGGAGAGGDTLGSFTEQEINSALLALEAEFGMTREQLLQDQTQLGAQYRLLASRLERARQMGVQSAESDAVSRGIYRSGILGENIQQVEGQYQEATAQNEQQRLAEEQSIQTQLQFLDQQRQAQAAGLQGGILRSSADYANQAGMSAGQAGLAPAGSAGVGGGPGNTGALGNSYPGGATAGSAGGFVGAPPQSTALQDQYTMLVQQLMAQGFQPNTPEFVQALAPLQQQMQAALPTPTNANSGYTMGSNGVPTYMYQTPGMEGSGQYYTNTIDKGARVNALNIERIQANPEWYTAEQRARAGVA